MANHILSSDATKSILDHVISNEQNEENDDCSICLEPFTSRDPPTVTKCKHGYHLQCILEWSERSKECPMCWQILVLNDPSSQELLAARTGCHITQIHEFNHIAPPPYVDDFDFEEHFFHRQHTYSGQEEYPYPYINDRFSHTFGTYSSASSMFASIINAESSTQPPPDSFQRSSSSEFASFKESIKSKFSFASARFKESISESTHGFKEKILARNNTVKELSKEGIAGVARMITSKRNGGVSVSVPEEENSNSAYKGKKSLFDNIRRQISSGNKVESSCDIPPLVSHIIPCHPELPRTQSRK